MYKRKTRKIAIAVKLTPPSHLANEVKSVTVSIHSHGFISIPKTIGQKDINCFTLKGDERTCFMIFEIPLNQKLFVHGTATIDCPPHRSTSGQWVENRFVGTDIREIEPGRKDKFILLAIRNFRLFGLSVIQPLLKITPRPVES